MSDGSKYGYESTTGLTIQHGLFEALEEQKHRLGICMSLTDGRCFHYAKAGAVALSKGYLNMAALVIAGHEDNPVLADVPVFDKTVTITPATAALTVNQYAEGWLSFRDGPGEGQFKKIFKHPAAGIAAPVEVTLYDPITEALTATTSEADLIKNPYDEVIESAVEENIPSGVPLIDVPANYFFWNQTFGPANVLSDGAIAAGSVVTPGTAAGSVAIKSVQTSPMVGTVMLLTGAGEFGAIFLRLSP